MVPDWPNRISPPSLQKLLGVTVGSVLFGAGFIQYARVVNGSGPVLDVVSIFGLWSLTAVLVVIAGLPTAFGYNISYSYAISFGTLFGAVSVVGIAYVGAPPSQVEKFGYALVTGLISALVLGTLAVITGSILKRLTRQRTLVDPNHR